MEMKQKEIKYQNYDLRQSFQQNQRLAQSLRTSTLLQSHDKGQITQKFPSAKEYVKQARLEIQNMPLKVNEPEVNLQSRPTVLRLERTKIMIEKQLVSRRERHLEVLDNYEKNIEEAQLNEQQAHIDLKLNFTNYFNKSDQDINQYFSDLSDDFLIKQNFDILDKIASTIEQHQKDRNEQIFNLNNKLKFDLKSFNNTFISLTDQLEQQMMDISFILKTEIILIKETNLENIQQQQVTMNKRNQEFIEKTDLDQINNFKQYMQQMVLYQKKWRLIQHNEAIKIFQIDIQKDEYIMPENRVNLYENLKQTHLDIFQNRKYLIQQLQSLSQENLSQMTIEKFNNEAQKLNDISQNKYDGLFVKLKKSNEIGVLKTNDLISRLHNTLKLYNAELEIPLEELINTQFQPQIQNIQNNDTELLQSVLLYLEETDYQSQEVLNNISSFYLEIGKKLDSFKKTQTDLILKYEVVKAKAADQNDEELDNLSDALDNLKKSLRESVHHLMLDQQLQLIFEKVDVYENKIREFHEVNLGIAKNHPNLILDSVQSFERECAPHFKMAGLDQKEILEKQFKSELEEKIKQIIIDEEAEKERQANEQALKKGGKPPAKKDQKKAQQDFDIRFAELIKEQKPEQVEEFQMNGRTWVLYQKVQILVNQIQQIPDIKGVPVPQFAQKKILSVLKCNNQEDCRIKDQDVAQIITDFRNALFIFITNKQQELIQLAKTEDQEFIQNSLILLDERLKQHYPLKGQIEVEIYQKRSAQITEHKQKYERHARQVLDKNQLQSQQLNFYVEEAMKLVRQNNLKNIFLIQKFQQLKK